MVTMDKRFKNWKPPEFDEKGMTKWNWMCRHHENLKLGKNTDIGAFTYINAKYGVDIQENVQIGSHCSIYSESTIDGKNGKVTIKRNAKVGSHTVIMPGVTIGENATVAACSFVNKDVPEGAVVGGGPSKADKAKILLMGHGKWACMVLSALVSESYLVVGVVTETDEFNRKEKEASKRFAKFGVYDSLEAVAQELNLLVFKPADVNSPEFLKEITKIDLDYIVVVSYHQILREEILKKFENKIINIHFGCLPWYRGRAPINWAIINGERSVGITVHFMTEVIDGGPIILQKVMRVSRDERAIDVLLKGLPSFPQMVLKALRLLKKEKVKPIPQSPFEGSYFPRRRPDDGLIDFRFERALDIHNKVRALAYPYPGAFVNYKGEKTVIEETILPHIRKRISPLPGLIFGKTGSGGVKVTTVDGFIIINKLRKEEQASDYFKLGDVLQ